MKYIVEACYIPHGFKQEDLTREDWALIKSEFMRLRKVYCDIANSDDGFAAYNKDFRKRYPTIDYFGNDDIDTFLYGAYLTWRTLDAMKREYDKFRSCIVEPILPADGPYPDFGVKIKGRE